MCFGFKLKNNRDKNDVILYDKTTFILDCFNIMKKRSTEKELIDLGPAFYTPQEYRDCLIILFKINRLLGFFRDTVNVLKRYATTISVMDVGCGGGLFIMELGRYFPNMHFIGVDVSETAINLAQQAYQTKFRSDSSDNVQFQLQTQLPLQLPENSIDIILATLVCHHMSNDEMVEFFQNAFFAVRKAIVINDLHRHCIPYWFYKLMSPVFGNRLITHDGLISIKRSFKRKDWHDILLRANITHYQIKWRFPFRWRVIIWKS